MNDNLICGIFGELESFGRYALKKNQNGNRTWNDWMAEMQLTKKEHEPFYEWCQSNLR